MGAEENRKPPTIRVKMEKRKPYTQYEQNEER
jgi:hypothetical protein